MEKHILLTPLTYGGVEITEINLDLDSLSVIDLEKCERQTRAIFKASKTVFTGVIEMNKTYQSLIAAKASGLAIDVIRSLSARDYTQVCLLVMNFLLGGDSEEEVDLSNLFKDGKTQTSPTTATPPNLTASNPTSES